MLSEKGNILEMKLNNTLKSREDLPNEKKAEHQGKKENSDIKEGTVSEYKSNMFYCEECEFSFKSKKNCRSK